MNLIFSARKKKNNKLENNLTQVILNSRYPDYRTKRRTIKIVENVEVQENVTIGEWESWIVWNMRDTRMRSSNGEKVIKSPFRKKRKT